MKNYRKNNRDHQPLLNDSLYSGGDDEENNADGE